MAEINVHQFMTSIPQYFNPEKARGASGIVQCMFTGEDASDWVIKIDEKTCVVEEGRIPNPDLTLKADTEVGINLLMGELDPMRAYMLGKVKVFGDLALGLKLVKFFEM